MMFPTAPGVGMIGTPTHRHQLLVAGRLRHDVFHEQVVDLVTGRTEVLALHDRGGRLSTIRTGPSSPPSVSLDVVRGLVVPGKDDRQVW